jgi:PPP family 3-phenylpropionic acid transporter
VCAVIAAVFSFSVPRPELAKKTKETHSIWHTLKKPLVVGFFVVHFLLQFSHAPYYSFYSVYLEAHGYSRGVIGLLWALGVLAEVVAFTQSHRLLQTFKEYHLILACLLLASSRWLVIALAVDIPALLWLVQVLHAFSFAIFHAAAMSFIYREFSQGQQGQGQAIYSALWGLGVAVGSWLTGMVWLSLGATWIFALAAVSCWLAAMVLAWAYYSKPMVM